MAGTYCPGCGTYVKNSAFCGTCGTAIPDQQQYMRQRAEYRPAASAPVYGTTQYPAAKPTPLVRKDIKSTAGIILMGVQLALELIVALILAFTVQAALLGFVRISKLWIFVFFSIHAVLLLLAAKTKGNLSVVCAGLMAAVSLLFVILAFTTLGLDFNDIEIDTEGLSANVGSGNLISRWLGYLCVGLSAMITGIVWIVGFVLLLLGRTSKNKQEQIYHPAYY